MRHKKDCYQVLSPSITPWLCVVGQRAYQIPADNFWRVYSLSAKEYGYLVWMGELT